MDQGTGRTRDDLTPPTKAKLDPVDPSVETAIAAEMDGRPNILVCCPLAIEFDCVSHELANIAGDEARAEAKALGLDSPRINFASIDEPRISSFFIGRWYYIVVQSGLALMTRNSAFKLILFHPQQIWLLGFTGALDPSIRVGDIIEPNHLRDGQYGDRVTLTPLGVADRHEPIVTINEIASTPTDKALLRRQFDCHAVDMEAFALAKLCENRGIPFHTARAISDAADETFPNELNGIILPNGDLSMKRLAWALLKKPTLVGPLFRLWKNSRKAKEGLRLIVRRLVESLA